MRHSHPKLLVGLSLPFALAFALAWMVPSRPGPAAQTAEPPTYRPVTSDLMIAYIQPRHIKLWAAGSEGDWDYAGYEAHNIGGAFNRITTAIPVYKGMPNADLTAAFVTPSLAMLDTAIKAKDKAAFTKAYDALTAGCNGCHQTTQHSFIVVKRPDASSFPDQDFTPQQQ